MKFTLHSFKFAAGLLALSALAATGQVTLDFNAEGDFDNEFSGGIYAESETGGLDDTRCLILSDTAVTSFDGSLSESHAITEYTIGRKFTVGAYFKLGSLGTGIGAAGNILRLGVTSGGADNFGGTPFSSMNIH